jgi:hypothetical protein
MLRFVQENIEVDYSKKVQSTPEKKRVTWKPILEEYFSVSNDASNGDEEPLVRCNLIKKCANFLDSSEQADACLESLQNHSAEVYQPSEKSEKSIDLKGPESALLGDAQIILASASSVVLSAASTESHIEEVRKTVLSGGLSEEEKQAGMKRRYSMLQQNFKMPVEEERRLKRERLRRLVPIWTKKRMDAQVLDGCKNGPKR